ncbi:hypothetical protein ITX54_05950 [Rouxiella silvae]|uniref:Uncharacterized protein n=1 Tax=Rouxiella silvae TaxID=1646373 RepID=A0AA41BVT3_9GAMM|nr:hypothetical protein [Rouxiella silvae]MBF6636207.1 hypothetical protein [Rouxiella silvae]
MMFFVKSCKVKDNVLKSGTIKIGSLSEYRKIESNSEVEDEKEGHFNLNVNINDKFLTFDEFNKMNNSNHSSHIAHIKSFNSGPRLNNGMKCKFIADYKWVNHNRFIFCLSGLQDHILATGIFKSYPDYWYVQDLNLKGLANTLAEYLLAEVKEKLGQGEEVFWCEVEASNLKVVTKIQKIIYQDRDFILDDFNFHQEKGSLLKLLDNVRFIKPARFSHEEEYRVVFDFYNKEEIVFPKIKYLIIDGDGAAKLANPKG